MSEKLSLPKGAEAYRARIEKVYSWIAGEISQDEFDAVSRGHIFDTGGYFRYTGDTYIDPTLITGGDINIWFVQLLMQAGHIEARKGDDGLIYYRRTHPTTSPTS